MTKFLRILIFALAACVPPEALSMDVNGQLNNARIENKSSDPASNLLEGRVVYNTTSHQAKVYNGTAWRTIVDTTGTIAYPTTGTSILTDTNTVTVTNKTISGASNTLTVRLANDVSGTLPVGSGGTGITSGTSGGVPYYSSSSTIASSGALTANGVVLGGGAGATPTATSAGSAYQPLRVPSGGGAPAFGALDISQSAAVTGALPLGNGGTGQTTGPAAFKSLAQYSAKGDVPGYNGTTTGVLSVGADGTVLTADAASTYGIKWGTSLTNPMTTAGDIIIGGSSGAATRKAIGTEGQILKSVSSAPAWSWPASVSTKTNASYTVTDTDGLTLVIMSISSSTARTLTLPAAANNTGRVITVRKIGSGAGRAIISGATETLNLYLADEAVTVVSDGSSWYLVAAQWASGSYSAAATPVSNTSSVSAQSTYFIRNKDVVTVSGNVTATIDGTADAILSVTLPIGAGMNNFADGDQAAGAGSAWKNSPNYHVPLIAQSVSSTTTVTLRAEGASASSGMTWSYTFQYKIQNP